MKWDQIIEELNIAKDVLKDIALKKYYIKQVTVYDSRPRYRDNFKYKYYDLNGVGEKIIHMIDLSHTSLKNQYYNEANELMTSLWKIEIPIITSYIADGEYGDEIIRNDLNFCLKDFFFHNFIKRDLDEFELMTLYSCYKVSDKEDRAKNMYQLFSNKGFGAVRIQDIQYLGYQPLEDFDEFWIDWIFLLKKKSDYISKKLYQEKRNKKQL